MTDYGATWKREDLGGGVFRHTQYLDQRHYFDGSAFREGSNIFVDSGDGTRPHLVTAAPLMFSVAPDGMRRIHPTRDLDRYAEIGAPYIKNGSGEWFKPNLGNATRSGSRITWDTAQVRLIIEHGGHFAKLAIFLKKPNGVQWFPNDMMFAFPVGLTGLTREGGTIKADGRPVMRLRAPHVEDLDNPLDVRPIEHEFVQINSQWYVVFTLPASLESNPMSRVLVDPTLELQPDGTAGKDASIWEGSTTTNWGASNTLHIGDFTNGVQALRALIQPNLDAIPDAAVFSSIMYRLYALTDWSANARPFRVYRLKRAWVEGTRAGANDSPATGATWLRYDLTNTWQTAGADGANDRELTAIGSRAFTASETLNEYKDFPLSVTTKAELDLGFGHIFIADTESQDRYDFASSDHVDAAKRPILSGTYTVGGVAPKLYYYRRLRA